MSDHDIRKQRIGLVFVLITVGLYLYAQINIGGIPHDEGLLGQSAERMMYGELPHRDFDDPYTGGQALLHALAFKLWGPGTMATRYVLYIASMVFVAVYYLFISQVTNAKLSVLVTWTAVAWSMPNYFAALPSWYNLFFATFGMWGLWQFTESKRRFWLLFAGSMGGLSFLIKLSGVFYLAAGILYIVFLEQSEHRRRLNGSEPNRWYSLFSTACLVIFLAGLSSLIRSRSTLMDWIIFVAPSAILAIYLIFSEWKLSPGRAKLRFRSLLSHQLVFLLGFLLPVSTFMVPYMDQESLQRWWNGVFVLPQKRVEFADYPLPPITSLVGAVPLLIFLGIASFVRRRIDSWLVVAAFAVVALAVCLLGTKESIYTSVWNATRPSVLCLVIFGVYGIWRRDRASHTALAKVSESEPAVDFDEESDVEDLEKKSSTHLTFLVLAMAAMTAWVQFPYSFGIYFSYVAPLVIAAGVVVYRFTCAAVPRIGVSILFFLCMFAVLWLNTGRVQRMGIAYVARSNEAVLENDRSGLWVTPSEAELYEEVVKVIQDHSEKNSFIYATLDCPEIYFLSARRNPTRTFYDFFEPDFEGSSRKRIERIVRMLDAKQVRVVVFKWQGEFSGALSYDLAEAVATRFPNVQHFAKQSGTGQAAAPVFSVAWRD